MALRTVRVKVGGEWYNVEVDDTSTSPVRVIVEGETFLVEVPGLPPRKEYSRAKDNQISSGESVAQKIIRSPMPGKVMAISVKPGQHVDAGQELCILEAMKMEQSIRSGQAGVIKKVHVKPMQQVGVDDPLVEFK